MRAIVTQSNGVRIASPGPQGPIGPSGLSSAGYPPIKFSYGDATPTTLLTLGVTSEIARVSLEIITAFNGTGASIKLGTAGVPGLLMDSIQNDPSQTVVFETVPRAELAAGTQLILTIVPGAGATTGSGEFVLSIVPST